MNKKLHIICFDVPFPADYGGVIDVYYKVKSLAELGVGIYLHVFQNKRKKQDVFLKYCSEVHYYKRKTNFRNALWHIPYIVKSRFDQQLVKNIERIDAPILFEGLHTTYLLKKKIFEKRKLIVRTHNIEHQYYKQLAMNEINLAKKMYYMVASIKLKNYEKVLNHCDQILAISKIETEYFKRKYGDKVTFLPAFHPNRQIHELTEKGYFALYHGNLNVLDNLKAALFLIDIFQSLPYPLVIAGQSTDKKLLSRIDQFKNISFISITHDKDLIDLFSRAHINVLFSSNNSGVKLKLINSLFQSRFVIANNKTIKGSGLDSLCIVANGKKEILKQVLKMMDQEFTIEEIANRKKLLEPYDNLKNAETLKSMLWD